jgi:hypothetical protein
MLLMACNMPLPDAAADDDDDDDDDAPLRPVSAGASLLSIIQTQRAAKPAWGRWVAEHFTAELAGDLFLAAAARGDTEAMTLIDSIKPKAVPAAAVYTALAEAVQQEQMAIVAYLVQLPAAKHLQRAECEVLLGIAMAKWRKGVPGLVLPLVVELPALTGSVTFDQMYEVFKVAAQLGVDDGLLQYVQLPAVQLAAPVQLQQLLLLVLDMLMAVLLDHDAHADMSASSIEVVLALLQSQRAQELDSDMIKNLLEASFSIAQRAPNAATGVKLASVWVALCQLPQALGLDHTSIISFLEVSLSRGAARSGHSGTAALCSLLEQKSAQAGWVGLSSQQAEQLLACAVPTPTSGSVPGLKSLCSLECVQRAVDNSAAMRLLGSALMFGKLKACRDPAAATKQMLQLPAAAAIPALDLLQMTACVVQQCPDEHLTSQLLELLLSRGSLPGADELVSLIATCLQDKADPCAAAFIHLLCDDPAAQQISVSTTQLLLLQAVESQQPQAMLALAHRLSAVFVKLSSKQVAQLLLAAGDAALDALSTAGKRLARREQKTWLDAVCAVISIPAVHEVDADVTAQLLAKATSQGAVQYLGQFLGISSLQRLENSTVGSLLQLAVQQQQHACVRLLAGLPGAAASLGAEQMMQFLQDSVQKDDHKMATTLCEVQSENEVAQSLKPYQVEQLLTAALTHGNSLESVVPLCMLPAAKQLPTACIELLVNTAEKALEDICGAVVRERTAEADRESRMMMNSMPYSSYGEYSYRPKMAAGVLTPSQVARQTVAAVKGSPRVQLAMRVVAALRELQAAAHMHGK